MSKTTAGVPGHEYSENVFDARTMATDHTGSIRPIRMVRWVCPAIRVERGGGREKNVQQVAEERNGVQQKVPAYAWVYVKYR